MDINTIVAEKRDALGKRAMVSLREQGRMPAVIYGQGGESCSVSLDYADFDRELRARHRVFKVKLDGKEEGVFLQDLQLDALTDEALHADFLRIDLNNPIPVTCELSFLGIPKGQAKGGTLVRHRRTIDLMCLPSAIPLEIEVRVGDVDLGDAIRAADLTLGEGVSLNCPENTMICNMPA